MFHHCHVVTLGTNYDSSITIFSQIRPKSVFENFLHTVKAFSQLNSSQIFDHASYRLFLRMRILKLIIKLILFIGGGTGVFQFTWADAASWPESITVVTSNQRPFSNINGISINTGNEREQDHRKTCCKAGERIWLSPNVGIIQAARGPSSTN